MVERGVADVYAELAATKAKLTELQRHPPPAAGVSVRVSLEQPPAKASAPAKPVHGPTAGAPVQPQPLKNQDKHDKQQSGPAHVHQVHQVQQQQQQQQHQQGLGARLKHRPAPVATDHQPFSFQSVSSSLPTPTVQPDTARDKAAQPPASTGGANTFTTTKQASLEHGPPVVPATGPLPAETVRRRMAASATAWALLDSSSSEDEQRETSSKGGGRQGRTSAENQVQHMVPSLRISSQLPGAHSGTAARRSYSSHAGAGRVEDGTLQQHAGVPMAAGGDNYTSPPARRQRWTISEIAEHTSPRQLLRQGLGSQQQGAASSAAAGAEQQMTDTGVAGH
jgi:hypothetical protein